MRRTGNLCSLLVFILQEHLHKYNNITVVTTIFQFARTFSHPGFYVSGRFNEMRKRKRPTGAEQANDLTTPDRLRSAIVRCNSDGTIDDFPVSRRRSHFFVALPETRARGHDYLLPDVPSTAHASPRYDVHAEPVVVVVVVTGRIRRDSETLKPPMFFLNFNFYYLGTIIIQHRRPRL